MKIEMQSRLFSSILLLSATNLLAKADSCEPDSTDKCIKPVATGTVNFEFEPLFPKGANLTYGFDVQSDEEVEDGEEPIAKGGIWLDYDTHSLNGTNDMTTELVLMLNETITGTPGGGHNGCDDIWTSDCSNNMTDFVKYMYTQVPELKGSDRRETRWLRTFNNTAILDNSKARRVACPVPVLGALPFGKPHVLALEGKDLYEMSYKGNSSYMEAQSTFRIGKFDLEKAEDVVSFAMVVRAPVDRKLYEDVDNIQVEMMCIKPTSKMSSEEKPEKPEDPEEPKEPDSAAISRFVVDHSIFWPVMILTFMTATGLMFA